VSRHQRPTPRHRLPAVPQERRFDTAFLKVPSWRFVGPDGSNRVIAVAGVREFSGQYYANAASGWPVQSTNGGW
jgi:hypothetical protein